MVSGNLYTKHQNAGKKVRRAGGLSRFLLAIGILLFSVSAKAAMSFDNGSPQSFTVCQNAAATSINALLQASGGAGTYTWTIISGPLHGTLVGFPATAAAGAGVQPSGTTYQPLGGYEGSDAFTIQVSDGSTSATTTINVTVGPDATNFSISPSSICQGVGTTVNVTSSTLPAGTYSMYYNITGVNSASNVVATVTMAAGSGSFVTANMSNAGITTVQVYSVTGVPCGGTVSTPGSIASFTVNSNPGAIFVPGMVCVGSTITLTDPTLGGTWTSSNTGLATVGSASGVTTGISNGTPNISYTLGTGCYATAPITVNATPNGITGSNTVCTGNTTNLTETSVGGTWSSSNPGVGSVNSSGVVTGIASGTPVISYTFAAGPCYATFPMTVNSTPPANTGTASVCTGLTTTLANGIGGGTWSSTNTGVASVGSASGVVSGIAAGTATISYVLNTGCYADTPMTVNGSPSAISGANTVCVGANTTLTNSVGGGTWSSSNPALGSIGSVSGIVTGIASGTPFMTYTLPNGCFSVQAMTVNPNPAAITGSPFAVCTGSTITVADATGGGSWSSSNSGLASVGSASGVVSGIAVGTPTISYTLATGCYAVQAVTVNQTPSSISGSNTVCVGQQTTLTDATGGGNWSSANTSVAVVGAGTGIVTGVATGNTTISYIIPSTGCFTTTTMTTNPNPVAIAGAFTVCTATTTTLTDATSGGTWSSSNTGLGTVGAGTGVVGGVSAGNPIITYTLGTGCYATQTITVNSSPAAIGGTFTVCTGTTTTLTDATAGGTWSSSSTGQATVGSGTGVVSGVSTGTPTITYTAANACIATQQITVNPNPAAIAGSSTVCTGVTTVLTDATTGGTWSSSDNTKATIGAGTGTVTGVGAGNVTMTYTLATGCQVTFPMTVNASPVSIAAFPAFNVCVGFATTLSDGTGGGTWSSSNTSLATVGAGTGIVTGVAAGVPTISYVLVATGCYVTAPVTVNSNPAAIGGSPVVCVGSTTLLTDATGGGTWTSSDITRATVGAGTGVVTGQAAGNPNITYTLGTGCYSLVTATVNPLPASITGTMNVCVGFSTTLADATAGGTWSSSNTGIATVGAGSGTVTGVAAGVVTISYVLTATGCYTTTSVTVNANPAAIGGNTPVCVASSITMTDATGGGTWTSSNIAQATVGAGTGVVTGVSASNPTITYTLPTGCISITVATVNPLPAAITGTMNVCVGLTTTLADASAGGTWSSSNTSEATVGAGSGVVTGVAAGVPNITYVLTVTGCYVTAPVTVNPNPAAIGGPSAVCTGATITVTDATTGGTWSSSNTAWATVNSTTGVVTGVAVGTPNITYTLPTGCISIKQVTVNQTPVAIAGPSTVCVGTTITLTDATSGGTWSSSNTSQATIGAGSGIVTGLSAGVPIMSYVIVATGCYNTTPVTVNALPAAITGPSTVCTGSSIGLADATSGGTWSSSNTAWATVNSTSGVVTGVAAGTPTITYTLPTGCIATYVITVNTTPGAVTGTMTVCVGLTTTLADGTSGGSWSSSNTSEATVGAGTGVVTGVAAGTPVISYVMGSGCYAVATVTVNSNPAAITGTASACTGSTTTLADATTGGTWSSSNTAVGTVGSTTGIVAGISAGTATITYTLPTGCIATYPITIATTPAAITGTLVVCAGSNTTLADGTSGGTWSSGNTGIATVGSASGVVSGVASGVAGITYTMASGCFAATTVTVNPVPNISNFTSTTATSPCAGGSSVVTISSTSLGVGSFTVTYNLSGANSTTGATATLTMGATNGTFTIPSGLLTTTGFTTVTVTAISNSFGCVSNPGSSNTYTFAVNALPTVYTVLGGGAYCAGGSGVHIFLSNSVGGINYQLYQGASPFGTPLAGTFAGLDFGLITAVGTYTVSATNATTGCTANMAGSATVSTNPLPSIFAVTGGGSYCAGGTGVAVGLASSQSGINYQLYIGGSPSGSPVGGTGSPISFGLQTTGGVYTVVATDATTGCTNNMTGSATVVVNPLPAAITGTMFACPGTTTTLSDATAGGTWSSSTPSVGTVGSTTGVVFGVAAGTTNITYTLTGTGCTNFTTVTINSNPAAIAGPTAVCVGSAITLTDATGGGNWTSSNSSLASINIATGVVLGNAAGTPTMTYTLSTGCFTTFPITVNTTPAAISGSSTLCTGFTTTLTDATSGGTWSSSNPGVGTVGAGTGVVGGISAGTATITYTLPGSCIATYPITIATTPPAITGTTNACVGFSSTLADASSGGSWTSSNTSIATVGPVSGIVSGLLAGTVTITYTMPSGCTATTGFTVNPTPGAITGVNAICVGTTTTLGDATAGGTWTSSNPAIGTIGGATGILGGISGGTATITYTLPAGCTATYPITINTNPASISGTAAVCVNSTTTLSDATTGGTWSSSNPAIGTIGSATGVVGGIAAGNVTITYSLATGCIATQLATVNPLPAAITGVAIVCTGQTTTLSDASGGGTWTSANPAIGSVAPSTGVVTGVSSGNTTITYTLPTGCLATTGITVNPTPAAITGASFVCVGQTTTLSDATPGGTWASSNVALGTIGSASGVVGGIATGVPVMTYTLPAGCFATYPISVNPMPAAITGVANVCVGLTTTLSDATGGGTWTSGNVAIGSVGSGTGIVTGVSAGNVTISYTLSGGCFVTQPVTVNPSPSAITGSNNVCIGLTTGLSDGVSGGTWSSSNPGVANIGSASGIVTGASVGTATITYTLPAGCFTTMGFTVNPLPASITGTTNICVGISATLTDASSGGTWTSSNTAIATIGASSGVVTGISAGTVTITYTLPTTCQITTTMTINPLPTIFTITGGGAYCSGGTGVAVTLTGSQSGANYQLYVGGVPTGSPVAGTGSAISFGLQTAAGVYTAVATTVTTGCINNMNGTATVTINLNPTVYNMTGGGSLCAGAPGVAVGLNFSATGVKYQLYRSGAPLGSPVSGTGAAISFGTFTGAGTYTAVATDTITACTSNMAGVAVIIVNPLPTQFTVTGGGAYCVGGAGVTIGLSGSQSGINYTVTNGVVSATVPGSGSPISFGTFTSLGTYTVNAVSATTGCTNPMLSSVTVSTNPLPLAQTFTGGGAYCAGGTGVNVGLAGSQSGTTYQLFVGGIPTGSPVTGTGGAIGFGLQTTAGIYTAVATNTTTGCTNNMTGSVTVTINPLPGAFTVTGGGGYCTGGTGVPVGLSGSVSGVNYQLWRNGTTLVTTLAGSGSALTFASQTIAATYTVIAVVASTGCTATMTGTAVVVVNPLPTLYSVTGGGSYCAGGSGMAIGLTNSDIGINYQLYLGASTVGTPVAGTGSALSFGTFTVTGIYTVRGTNPVTGCVAVMSSSATIATNPLPTAFNVTGGGTYCSGGAGVHIGLSGSTSGISYQLMLGLTPIGLPVLSVGSPIDFGFVTATGTYTVVATNPVTGCVNTMNGTAVISINSLPTVNIVTGGGSYCAGGAGVHVGLNGSSIGTNYQLYNGGIFVGSPFAGTGTPMDFGSFLTAGTYTVVAINPLTGCTSNMTGSATIVVNPLPAVYGITGGGAYCTGGTGVAIGMASSDTGVSYQLMLGGSPLGAPVAGTGSAISFGTQTTAGIYTATATNNTTGCTSNMSGSVAITINPLPAVFAVTGGGSYCPGGSGVTIGMAGSASGVNYQLYLGASAVGTPVAGTGGVIGFGLQTAVGSYTVVAINAVTGCTNTMSGSAAITLYPLPVAYTVTGGGGYCAGGSGALVGLSGSASGVTYQLYNGVSTVGVPVPGTGSALSFGLQTATGTYSVVATNVGSGCSGNMTGTVTVSLNPLPVAYTVTGGGGYCAGGAGVPVGLGNSDMTISYQLYKDGTAWGSPLAGTGGAISFGTFTGAGTYTVVGTNSITGCTNNMAGSATVMINPLPIAYVVTGGGSYCAGGTGVHVGLTVSDVGVNYQLMMGLSTVGGPVAGTGVALDFGLFTTAGTYTVVATNAVTGCTMNMSGSATVVINPLPVVYNVIGGGSYCAGGAGITVGLGGSNTGINYQLYLDGIAVGLAAAGTGGPLSFGAQTAAGNYTVVATDASTGCTNNMAGSATVVVNPLPFVDTVTGGGNYCPGGTGVHIGLTSSTSGVNYQLFRGTTSIGIPVAGTGSGLDFGLQSIVGTYFVVATDATTGCTSNMAASATVGISPLPVPYTVSVSSSTYCTGGAGVHVMLSGSQTSTQYQLYRGTLLVGTAVTGTGFPIDFGLQTAPGAYSVVATSTVTGCVNNMTGAPTVSISPLPNVYLVSGGGSYCAGGTGVAVLLGGSEVGVNYQLKNGSLSVGAPVAGTGYSINFGPQTAAGVYTVIATNATTGCTNNMLSSAAISINPLPSAAFVTGGGAYCAGGAGVYIGVNITDMGVNYQLYLGATAVGSPIVGTGSAITFGPVTSAGTYTVVATNATTGCSRTMTGSAVVAINPAPAAFNVVGGGNICVGGTGVHVGLSGSATGFTYQLMNPGPVGPAMAGTGSAIDFGVMTAAGTYTVMATNTTTGCTATMTGSALITISPLPSIYTVTGGGSYCATTMGAGVGLSYSDVGTNYQLYNGASTVGGLLAGTGSALSFGLQPAGTYTVVAINATTGCTSNMVGSVTVTMIPSVVPAVTITTGVGDTVCAGTMVNFTALATNGGSLPTFQWAVNGIPSGSTGSTYSYIPTNGNLVSVIMTSNATCASPATATNSVTMTVNANVTPAISITASPNDTVCQGTVVTFTANPVWGGASPAITWYVGGVPAAVGNNYAYAPANGDIVFAKLNSSYACLTSTSAVLSNNLTLTVDDNTLPDATIRWIRSGNNNHFTSSANPICSKQWSINGVPVPGAIMDSFDAPAGTLHNGDLIGLTVTKTNACGTLIGTDVVIDTLDNVGVQPVTLANSEIRLVPNPNKGLFNLKGSIGNTTDQDVTLEITDVLGKVIYTTKIKAHNGILDETVRMTDVANGMYLVTIRTEAEHKVFHMVVEQ